MTMEPLFEARFWFAYAEPLAWLLVWLPPVTLAVWVDVPLMVIAPLGVWVKAKADAAARVLNAKMASDFMMSSSKGTDTWSG